MIFSTETLILSLHISLKENNQKWTAKQVDVTYYTHWEKAADPNTKQTAELPASCVKLPEFIQCKCQALRIDAGELKHFPEELLINGNARKVLGNSVQFLL